MSTRRFQSSNRSRKHATSRRENDVFVRHLSSTNPNTLMNTESTLWQRFPPCKRYGTHPDKNDFRERYDLMSIMLTIGLFIRLHPVALLFVSTDLPARMTQIAMPRSVCPCQKFDHCQSASGNPHRQSLFLNSLYGTLSRIGCGTVPRCRLEFHQISRHVSSPCLPEPPLLALRHTSVQWRSSQQSPFPKRGMAFTTNKSASTATRVAACFCSVSPLADVVFTNPKSSGSQGAVLPSRASHYGDVGHLSHVP